MIKPIAFSFFIALLAIGKPVVATAAPPVLEPRLQWFTDARFGMFVHFGIHTVAGSEWNGQRSKRDLHLQQEFRIPCAEYTKLAARFNPAKFDARAWALMARNAGAKFILDLQPNCLINDRVGHRQGDYGISEQFIPGGKIDKPWESCLTINKHWGFDKFDHEWKSTDELLHHQARHRLHPFARLAGRLPQSRKMPRAGRPRHLACGRDALGFYTEGRPTRNPPARPQGWHPRPQNRMERGKVVQPLFSRSPNRFLASHAHQPGEAIS